jgi:thiol:disulfide interchange protein DsbD
MVESELARGSFVFVDFTAAWCITCQLNKRLVLDRKDVMTAFQARGVTLLRADWTRHDPQITRALERLERKGVPVYVLYRPGQAPKLLPEVLTKEIVLQALGAA